jgi:hypothetical protein
VIFLVWIVLSVSLRRRQNLKNVFITVNCQSDLLQVVGALHPASRRSRSLYRREHQSDQNPDYGNNDKKLDKRKGPYNR